MSADLSGPPADAIMWAFFAGALLPTLAYLLLIRPSKQERQRRREHALLVDDNDDSDGDVDDDANVVPSDAGHSSRDWNLSHAPYKMVLCVNVDLKGMQKGKLGAQCGHAAVGCYQTAMRTCPNAVKWWHRTGSAKICVQCPAAEFDTVQARAMSKDIPTYLVMDAGRTQIAAGSRTVLGLGPAPATLFDGVSDHLKLM